MKSLLLVFFFLFSFSTITLSSSSSVDNNNNDKKAEIVYDNDFQPLKTNTLYFATRNDGNYLRSLSYSPLRLISPILYPSPIVESGEPIWSLGAPIMFHSEDPSTPSHLPSPTINITTQTPLTITFFGNTLWWFRWFVGNNSRLLMAQYVGLYQYTPSFFLKEGNRDRQYHIAFEERHFVKIQTDSSSGLRRLAATGDRADSDILEISFSSAQCLDDGVSLKKSVYDKMMKKEASKAFQSIKHSS